MISYIVVGISFKFIFGDNTGIINYLLELFGQAKIGWLTENATAMAVVILATVWSRSGCYMITYISGLQSIPESYYEAAEVDGASKGKQFFKITLPMLSPTFVFLITTTIISTFSTYDLIKLMTQGGPRNSSNLLVYWIYETGYLHFNVGKAMAGGVMLLLFIGVISIANFSVMNKRAHYQ